ncbi:protein pollen defective in guidance 1 [Quercus suber]|uniref:Protein pollen defective in guidance 1 n=1 Tax=Quercus suber TaxID=58331 RepID=A0AAW0KB95_QUESU
MALRSDDRKLSFEVLSESMSFEEDESLFFYRPNSDPIQNGVVVQSKPKPNPNRKKRKHRRKKPIHSESSIREDPESLFFYRPNSDPIQNGVVVQSKPKPNPNRKKRKHRRKKPIHSESSIREDPIAEATLDPDTSRTTGLESNCMHSYSVESSSVCTVVTEPDFQNVRGEGFNFGELRQRSVSISGASDDAASRVGGDNEKEKEKEKEKGEKEEEEESGGEVSSAVTQRAKPNGSVGSNKLETEKSLDWKRLMAEDPNLSFTVDKSPLKYFMEEMYNGNALRNTTTIGNELIDVGFFVCLDSFLSLLTIMPTRIVMTLWRLLRTRQFKMWSAAELSDFGCFLIMACGVTLLQRTDISLIYHMIRGQGTIKLYVVYNVLEIFDRLCQNFNGDVMQTLFNSTEGLASCPPENRRLWVWRFIFDEALAMGASNILHLLMIISFISIMEIYILAITLSTVIVAHNNALLALLVSNNFAEIKSNVFKRFSKDNIHGLNALMVFICEMAIDIIKHSFIAKFNDIKPTVYSEFLEDLCMQTLNTQTESAKKNLTFVPLAPACVVIRVLTPVYAAHLPYDPLPWRLFWILFLCAMTYVMLTSLKVMIGMGLQKHATWYVNRCRKRKHHLHYD